MLSTVEHARVNLIANRQNNFIELLSGKLDGMHEMKMTNAILLHFQSIEDKEFGDTFYYENPRERIFRFWEYSPPSFYDADHPVSQINGIE